ncbi:MAG: hypothetical protein HOP08_15990 [Cyclobacteriaceae bacterium]|nr:hypothetical protein [Cyclobacteriaceae bacterium]
MKGSIDSQQLPWILNALMRISHLLSTNHPKSSGKKPFAASQQANRDRFTNAIRYAQMQIAKDDRRALYETGITRKKTTAYKVAMCDALTAPQVRGIDTRFYSGLIHDLISIRAIDDFRVARVVVSITTGNGRELEHGDAVKDNAPSQLWRYSVRKQNRSLPGTIITVTAFDHPGNQQTAEKVVGQEEQTNYAPVYFSKSARFSNKHYHQKR